MILDYQNPRQTSPKRWTTLAKAIFFAVGGCSVVFVVFTVVSQMQYSGSSTNFQIGTHYAPNPIGEALNEFEVVNGRFPTTAEGLQALVQKPAGADLPNWKQVLAKVPLDPWGHPYHYKLLSGGAQDFELRSDGPDGKPNTSDDISN